MTNNSILKLAGAFHCVKTSNIRFWAFSYSIGEPCGRSDQVIIYFISILLFALMERAHNIDHILCNLTLAMTGTRPTLPLQILYYRNGVACPVHGVVILLPVPFSSSYQGPHKKVSQNLRESN